MRAWRGVASSVALVILPLLAGCASTPEGPLPGLPAAGLVAGGYYAFHHGGGALVFTLDGDGDAAFDLYGADDGRIGGVGFSSEPPRSGLHRVDGVEAGELVVRIETLNGTLHVESGGSAVRSFRPLGVDLERVVLADLEPRADTGFGLLSLSPNAEPATLSSSHQLRRTPNSLRVLATGPWANLTVEVHSVRGPVLQLNDPGGQPGSGLNLGPARSLAELPSTFLPQNLRDGTLSAVVRADDLAGAVLLESATYSRTPLPTPGPAGPAVGDVAFTYGRLPDTPVGFQVHEDARRLLLWDETGAGNASVALFDRADVRIATVLVPANGTVVVPVALGGEHVAVALSGAPALGADHAPADFGLRPLDVAEATAPGAWAGSNGRYAQAEAQLGGERVFALRPAWLAAPDGALPTGNNPLMPCDVDRLLRVEQGGEAVLAVTDPPLFGAADAADFQQASLALGSGPLRVLHDGFGADGCQRLAVTAVAYVR